MERYIEIDKNEYLTTGKYRITFTANIFPEQIAWIIDSLSFLMEKTIEIVKGKKVNIYKVESDNNKIYIYFELLQNPIPAIVIVSGILGLLGLVGGLLVLDKIEKIAETPVGTGIGVSLVSLPIIVILGGLIYVSKNL